MCRYFVFIQCHFSSLFSIYLCPNKLCGQLSSAFLPNRYSFFVSWLFLCLFRCGLSIRCSISPHGATFQFTKNAKQKSMNYITLAKKEAQWFCVITSIFLSTHCKECKGFSSKTARWIHWSMSQSYRSNGWARKLNFRLMGQNQTHLKVVIFQKTAYLLPADQFAS